MSTRFVAAVLTLASIAAFAAAEDRSPLDVERALDPRPPAPVPTATPLDWALRLVWMDPAGVAIGADGLARDEARLQLQRLGASVSWRRGRAGEPTQPGEVRVILLDRAAEQLPGKPVLGATPPRFEGAPFVWVHVPNVRAAIGLSPYGSPAATEPAASHMLAIALGRVVAHELVHALAPSVPHGSGLMSATLTRRLLTAGSLPVDAEVGSAFRAALRGEPSLPSAATGVLTAATASAETVAAAETAGAAAEIAPEERAP